MCIEPSDAEIRIRECFEDKLGYLVIPVGQVGTPITSTVLDKVLQEFSDVQLPESYQRVFFYYFGHGNKDLIVLDDKKVECDYIIHKIYKSTSQQNDTSEHTTWNDMFYIFLFDSCRTSNNLTTFETQWKSMDQSLVNTLVIKAADNSSRAYFANDPSKQVQGCGLVTLYLTELAPMLSMSLNDLLKNVRMKVHKYVKEHPDYAHPQVLVFEDRLMGRVNLLAESAGSGK